MKTVLTMNRLVSSIGLVTSTASFRAQFNNHTVERETLIPRDYLKAAGSTPASGYLSTT